MSTLYQTNNELEKQYYSIKKKLEHFQYNYPLGLDSVQLVDKLLTDLLKTTQGYQELKSERDKLKAQLDAEKQVPLPLKNENSKLMKENNELHRELIRLKEAIELKDIAMSQTVKKLEGEKEEFSFLLKQKEIVIKSAESEAENLRRKMNEVLQKLHSTNNDVHTSTYTVTQKMGLSNADKILKSAGLNNTGRNIIGKKVEFDMTKGLDANSDYDNLVTTNSHKKLLQGMSESNTVDKEQWANDLKIADQRAEKMRSEIKRAEEEKGNLNTKIEFLEKQLQSRDLEIRRVQGSCMLNTDNIEELKARYQSDLMKNTIEKLNSQLDYLNEENQKLKGSCDFHTHRCKEEEVRRLDKEIIQLKKDKEALNKKLDSERKTGTMTPIIQDKPKFDSQNNPQDQALINTLKQELEKSNLHLAKLKDENKTSSSNSNSEKFVLVKSIEALKSELINTKQNLSQLEALNERISKENQEACAELNLHKGRELVMNQNFESRSENVNKISAEYSHLMIDNKDLRKKINDFEEQNLKILKELKELKIDKDSLQKKRLLLENNLTLANEQNEALKNDFENLKRSLEKNENQKKIVDTRNKISEEENGNLSLIIEEKNYTIRELENKKENLFKQLTDANDNYVTLQADNKNLSSEIQSLLMKNKKFEDKIKNLEREFNESKYVKEKLCEFEEKEKNLKNDLKISERENKVLKNEIKFLNEKIKNSDKENEKLNNDVKFHVEDKKKLAEKIENSNEEFYKLEEREKFVSDLNSDIEENKLKISELNSKINVLKKEIENFKLEKSNSDFELKKKNLEISRLTESSEKHQSEIKNLKEEIKNISSHNEKLEEKIFNKKLQDNTNIELNLLETREVLSKEKSFREKLSFDYKALQETLMKANEDKNYKESKILSLTNLLNEADKTREELFTKLSEELKKNKVLANDLQIFKEKEGQWLGTLNKLNEENMQLRTGLNSIDENFNSLNNDLDTKTEDNAKLTNLVQNLSAQNDEITKKLQIQLNKTNLDSKRINDREEELGGIKQTIHGLQQENFEFKSALEERIKQMNDLNYDIQCVQMENQTLIEDLNRVSNEGEKTALIKAQLEKSLEFISQKNRAMEIDLNEIHANYKDVCQENERLKQNLNIFIEENREAASYIKQIEGVLMNYKTNIQEAIMERDNIKNKVDFLHKYNSELTEEIANLKNQLAKGESNQNMLIKNVQIDKEISSGYETQMANLNRHIAKLENEKRNLIDEMNNLNNHIEYLSHNNKGNEVHMKKYETIIAEERKRILNSSLTNEKLRGEISAMRDENKRILSMINENRDIKELKNKILTSSLNNSRSSNYMADSQTNNKKSPNVETEADDNGLLKRLVNDLNSQIEELKQDLQTVKEENYRLISERSKEISFDRGVSSERRELSSGTNSVYSLSNR